MSVQSMPVVTVCDGIVTTLSTDVASFFEKRHNDVIRTIETIIATLPVERLRNFAQTVVTRANPSGGAPIQSKAYRLTRDGFTFLAMGFTGAKAQAFKWAYIDAFNKMEAELQTRDNMSHLGTLTPAQQLLVRQAVASRAKTESKHYHTIYRAIYNRFQIARYDQLQQTDLNECLKFIQEVDLRVPEVRTQPAPLPAPVTNSNGLQTVDGPNGQIILLSHTDLERLRDFVFYYNYIFRREMELFYEFLNRMKSPYAPRFYESITSPSLVSVERILEKVGYPVK